MPAEPDPIRVLTTARYSYAEADHLAGVSRGTTRRWLQGGALVVRPGVVLRVGGAGAVSFINLVEIAAVGRLREQGFSLRVLRDVVDNCQSLLGVEHPFVTLKFKAGGHQPFVDSATRAPEIGKRKAQLAWSGVLEPFFQQLDYSSNVAIRWWPVGRECPVVIDPAYGFGLPVVAGSGVRTEILLERFQAGDLSAQIAQDFNLDPVQVERALQFELARAA